MNSTKRSGRPLRELQTITSAAVTVAELLDGAAVVAGGRRIRVLHCGPKRWNTRAELTTWARALPGHWETVHEYHDSTAPAMSYRNTQGLRVDVLRASQWFGGEPSPVEAANAWRAVSGVLAARFDMPLLATPATTGRELFARTIPNGTQWPILDLATRELIRSESGQGRIAVTNPDGRPIERVVAYDGRLMYAALTWKLPAGEPIVTDRWHNYARGRYKVRFAIPNNYNTGCVCGAAGHEGIGPLAVKSPSGGWEYPSEPGYEGVTWADGAEIHAAMKHGISCNVITGIVWPDEASPLDNWTHRLTKAIGDAQLLGGDGASATTRRNVGRALRALIIHTLGIFHAGGRWVTGAGTIDQIPSDATGVTRQGSVWTWRTHVDRVDMFAHPEWSACVYGRARARMYLAACSVPAADVLGFATDALYLASDPRWRDDGKVGTLRRTKVVEFSEPQWRPQTMTQLYAMVR